MKDAEQKANRIVEAIRSLDGCVGGYAESVDIVKQALISERERALDAAAGKVEEVDSHMTDEEQRMWIREEIMRLKGAGGGE